MSEIRNVVPGDFYRHFKNKLYQIKGIAYHSETKEKMVVYQAMYGDFQWYVRPYDMFVSEVDHWKYPDVTQKYRFERIEISDISEINQKATQQENELEQSKLTVVAEAKADVKMPDKVNTEVFDPECINEEEGVADPRLLQFLDADNYQEKLNVLTSIRGKIDDKLIDDIATCMDLVIDEGPVEQRYDSLRNCITAHAKYECNRLR